MAAFRKRWEQAPDAIRKPLIFIVGSTVIITGIALLVLPGPGWAAIFLGIAILASEFAYAARVRDWVIKEVKTGSHNMRGIWKTIWKRVRGRP